MLLNVFTVFDSKSGIWMHPFCSVTKGSAMRDFVTAVNDPQRKSVLSTNPEDFTLFHLGQFNDGTGGYILNRAPESVMTATEARSRLSTEG